MIGWVDVDADALYLDPASSYAVAQQLGAQTGRTIPTSVTTLGKRLMEARWLVTADAGRTQSSVYISSARHRLWYMRLSEVIPAPETGEPDREPTPIIRKGVA